MNYYKRGGSNMEYNIGKRIKNMREKNGLTQKELAEKLGVSRQALSNYESDKRLPDIYVVAQMADVFSVTVDTLIGLK